jgi:hypothetical protein
MNLDLLLESLTNEDLNPDNLTDLDEFAVWLDEHLSSIDISKAIVDFLTLHDLKREIISTPMKTKLAYKLLVVHFIYLIRENENVVLDILNLAED